MKNTRTGKRGNYEARNSNGELLASGSTIESVENEACFKDGYVYDRKGDRFFVAGRYPINRHNWIEGRFLPEYLRTHGTSTKKDKTCKCGKPLVGLSVAVGECDECIIRGSERDRAERKLAAELISISSIKAAGGSSPFICADLVDQDVLFDIQGKLMDLINRLDRNAAIKAFPFMYKKEVKV